MNTSSNDDAPQSDDIHQQLRRRTPSSQLPTTFNRISSSFSRHRYHSSNEDDNRQRRMSGWAVFGAVIDHESFSRSMSDYHQLASNQAPHNQPPSLSIPSSSRICSPTRGIFQEPDQILHTDLNREPSNVDPDPSKIQNLVSRFKSFYSQQLVNRLPSSFQKDFRVILKCSLAYLIASLFSFYDPLAQLLVLPFGLQGPFSGSHVIATIVTYYRPAATIGLMMEANHYAFWGLFWLAVIIVGSTITSVMIVNRTISHAIVLIFFVGFGYGSMAWVKLKSPGFASTCSMIIVISSVIITREGSIHFGYLDFKKTLIYMEIILIGMLISNLTCLAFWRGSATDKLQKEINNNLDSFSTLIGMLTKTFLLDETIYTDQEQLKRAIDRHQSSFTSLKQSLDAAVYEFFEPRIQHSQESYKESVASMNRLAQHLTGLRSGCSLQYKLMGSCHSKNDQRASASFCARSGLAEPVDLGLIKEIFDVFCEAIGPSLKTLMATGVACLHAIKTPSTSIFTIKTGDPEAGDRIDKITHMRAQLSWAIQVFEESHSVAMNNLYASFITRTESSSLRPSSTRTSSESYLSAQLNEEIFSVCFFLFNMEEFMHELCHLLDIFADIRADEEVISYRSQLRWTRFRRRLNVLNWRKKGSYEFTEPRKNPRPRRQRPKLTAVLPLNPKASQPFPLVNQKDPRNQGEQNSSRNSKIKQMVYNFTQQLRDPDAKTAIKIGAGAALMTLPAFCDSTRPLFHYYRAQWAVVTYMIVMAATLGQTNFLVITRMLGTLVGSGVAIAAQYSFCQNPVALPIIGFMFSVPCFWLIVSQPPYASTGRFLLLSYNLVCVYSYNVRDHHVEILLTAYHRILCVFVGVLFGWVINSFVWPYKARRELRKCLSEFLLESAFLYSYLVKHYSTRPAETDEQAEPSDPHSSQVNERSSLLLLGGGSNSTKAQLRSRAVELSKMEMFLQVKLNRLFALLSATRHEPRLKGPFPQNRYRTMLNGCQAMLDMLHSLRAVTGREEWFGQSIREDFFLRAKAEHRELVGNVVLFFGLLGSTIELKAPLPPYLPPGSEALVRFLRKIYRLSQSQSVRGTNTSSLSSSLSSTSTSKLPFTVNPHLSLDNDHDSNQNEPLIVMKNDRNVNYSLFFAFAVAVKHVLGQLESIAFEAQSLFGIIGGIQNLSEFEEIFR